MSNLQKATAYPRKSFFLEMFTRDITLEDAILDLIDNAIDALGRNYSPHMFEKISSMETATVQGRHKVSITYSNKRIAVTDNCGGIAFNTAKNDVFNFGHPMDFQPAVNGQLGVYGIGLKRAAFKMGRRLRMVSRASSDGFALDWDIEAWGKHDDDLEDWTIPIKKAKGMRSSASRGTKIVVERLRPEVLAVLSTPEFKNRLWDRISTTYTWFLGEYVTITVNGNSVPGFNIPIGKSEDLNVASESVRINGVHARLWAGITGGGLKGKEERHAGWYVMCNGRVVVSADKSDLTGWGEGAAPQWHDKYRGFVGLAFFTSSDNLSLPWTTTKRGLHRESPAYLTALNRMRSIGRPVLQFLSKQYGQDPEPSRLARSLAKEVKITNIHSLPRESAAFEAPVRSKANAPETVTVRLTIPESKVRLARKHLGNPELAPKDVVLKAFESYLEMKGN
jgi:hypothetical protein